MNEALNNKDFEQINQFTRDRVGISTLERYTGSLVSQFQPYVLLTNFFKYVKEFSELLEEPLQYGSAMVSCHSKKNGISIVNFSIGSPMAALMIELLSFIKPKATLMLGLCGGLRPEHEVGNYFNPIAAIREEGTSDAYMAKQCPSLSSFVIQRYVCKELEKRRLKYFNGVIHTTNVRFWEFNEEFKKTLLEERVQAIDMECATLFTVGFARFVPVGALMLISDLPLQQGGVKTEKSAKEVFNLHTKYQIEMGISILENMQEDEKAGHGYNF